MVPPNPNNPEPLKYAMLGEDISSTEEKLGKYTGTVDWKYLQPHFLSGVLYFVDPSLALTEVGAAFSEDGRERVEVWLKAGDVVKIANLHASGHAHQMQDILVILLIQIVM